MRRARPVINPKDDDLSQISQPLSKATLQLVQAALQLENAQQAMQRAMRLSAEYATVFYYDLSRIQGIIDTIRREVTR